MSEKIFSELNLKALCRPSLVKLLRRYLRATDKDSLVSSTDKKLENHKIFDILDEEFESLPYVVSKICKDKRLDQIASEMEADKKNLNKEKLTLGQKEKPLKVR
jgi:hypothetical protein